MSIQTSGMPRRLGVAAAAAALLLSACGDGRQQVPTEPAAPRDALACTDFYAAANQQWLADTPLVHGKIINLDTGFAARNQAQLLARLEALAAAPDNTGDAGQQALVALFASQADRAAVERAGLAPLAEDLALIDGLQSHGQLPGAWGALLRLGVPLPVRLDILAFDHPQYGEEAHPYDRLAVSRESIGPARRPDPDLPGNTPAEFAAHIARTLVLTGRSAAEAQREGAAVAAIEQALEALKRPAAQGEGAARRAAAAPLALDTLLAAAGVPPALPRRIDDTLAPALGAVLPAFDMADWRAFLRWRLARGFTDHLPAAFADERARWDPPAPPVVVDEDVPIDPRIGLLAAALPRPLDLFHTRQVLPPATRAGMDGIAQAVRAALHRHIDSRDWLGAASRAASHHQLDTVELLYPGGPDALLDGDGPPLPALRRDRLLDNLRLTSAHGLDRRFALALRSHTGRGAAGEAWWQQDARYLGSAHRVLISPLIVQALLALGDGPAAHYGGFGTLVAHEMLHMFGAPADRQFVGTQSLAWLDPADRPRFDSRVEQLQQHYADWVKTTLGASVLPRRFMGEDLSDLGGVAVSLAALRAEGPPGAAAEDGFFRAYAATHRTRQAEAEDRDQVSVPAHALYRYRVNGPLSNLGDFAARYGCVAGDAMVRGPQQRVDLW